MKKILPIILLCLTFHVNASTLETSNYIIQITNQCEEGNVSCDKIKYVGTSKKSGKSITLMGSTWHTISRNGSPGRFLGYKFKNTNVTYYVTQDGKLSVVRNKSEVLLEEKGTWK